MCNCSKTSVASLAPTKKHLKTENMHIYRPVLWKRKTDAELPNMDPSEYGLPKNQVMNILVPVLALPAVALAPVKELRLLRCSCMSDNPCLTQRCNCNQARYTCTMVYDCKQDITDQCNNDHTKCVR